MAFLGRPVGPPPGLEVEPEPAAPSTATSATVTEPSQEPPPARPFRLRRRRLPHPGMISDERMIELNICEDWLTGKGFCWGRGCGKRHPRWEGGRDLFRAAVCHKHVGARRVCHRGDQCRHMHLDPARWIEALADIVGERDAAWDCAGDPEPPEVTPRLPVPLRLFDALPQGRQQDNHLPQRRQQDNDLAQGQQQDTLTRLLITSPVLDAERVVLDMLRIVEPDRALERYLLDVLGHVRN